MCRDGLGLQWAGLAMGVAGPAFRWAGHGQVLAMAWDAHGPAMFFEILNFKKFYKFFTFLFS
jgi:hypothetical protein